jgi:DNA polymerase
MKNLYIDIETRSSADIGKVGSYRYAEDKDFKILLFAYKVDEQETRIIDLTKFDLPEDIVHALFDSNVKKHAYNAQFEWYCLNKAGYETPLEQWECSMIHVMYCGYPASLAAAGKAIGIEEDKQKMAVGKSLIKYFCTPQKDGTFHKPSDDLDKWELFKTYCIRDVDVEYDLDQKLKNFTLPEKEWNLWRMDVEMNACGVHVDTDLINGAITIRQDEEESLMREAKDITKLSNPNSPSQLLGWVNSRLVAEGKESDVLENLNKATVSEFMEKDGTPKDIRRALEIRQSLGKTSLKKYDVMIAAKCEDDRVRGVSQFYGANRTGRWAGRLLQLQNMTKNHMGTIDEARKIVKSGNTAMLKAVYGSDVHDTLSQLVRTALIPSDGNHFVVADFSAIEARVVAWIAGEKWVNEVFATHGKIYEATASQMFGVPVDKIKKGNPEYALRAKGKVATLALGYQGGAGSLITMGALKMGLTEEELPEIVHRWRNANQNIVRLWYSVENAAIAAVQTAEPQATNGILFHLSSDIGNGVTFLNVRLPSGRELYYPKPFIGQNRFGNPSLHFWGINQTNKKWEVQETYGGKLVENIVQATARDCLAVVLLRVQDAGYQTVFHVHDEVIVDAPMELTVERLCELMAEPIDWAPGLVLKGAGFEGEYYKKD